MLKVLRRFIDWFVTPEDKSVPVENRKGRFFVSTLVLMATITLTNLVFFLGDPDPLPVIGTGIVLIFISTFLLLYRRHGKRALFVNAFNVLTFGLIGALIYQETGGIYSSDIMALAVSSAWTFLLAGRKSGIVWFVISALMVGIYYWLDVQHAGVFLEALGKVGASYNLMNNLVSIMFLFFVIAIHQSNSETYLGEINQQKLIIEVKNKEILDSISYAKRLQEAILPPLEHVKEVFNDFFILYKPKDIVAGDFYWMERRGHHVFFAVADCTGHGVPGAMVSLVCSNALNHAVRDFKLNDPGIILDKVSDLVQQTFEKSRSDVNDGMDISLLVMDTTKREIFWCGANNSLWLVRNGKLEETKANKQPIGRYENRKPFASHTIAVKSGDIAYLFTDGYADQFGGPKGKKFKYKQLQSVITSLANLPAAEQERVLSEKFENWRGDLDQVDDVCIAGIRFN